MVTVFLFCSTIVLAQEEVQAVPNDMSVQEVTAQDSIQTEDEAVFVDLAKDVDVVDASDQQDEGALVVSNGQQGDDEQEGELYLLDGIRAVVMSAEKTELVTQSDLDRPNLNGQMLTLDQCVDECRFYLDAIEHKIQATEEQIDRSLLAVQRQNNMTLEDLKSTFAMNGLTYTEARELLGRLQTVSTVLDVRVNGNVLVPRSEVLAYFEENPQVYEAVYFLQRAVVPFAEDKDAQRAQLVQMTESKEGLGGIPWSSVFSIEYGEVADDKEFIHTSLVGDVIVASQTAQGFELYKLVDKKDEEPVSLEERYQEIEMTLRQPLHQKLLQAYRQTLSDKMPVIFL